MAIIAYPLNNIDYTAEDAMLLDIPISSGVLATEDNLELTLTGDLTASLSSGIFFMRLAKAIGFTGYNNSAVPVVFSVANASLPRIDRVVLQFSASANAVSVVVKQGEAASAPVAPIRETSQTTYELVLFDVLRPAGSTAITTANITDQRANKELCGLMENTLSALGDFLNKKGDTMEGKLVAQSNTAYASRQVRNIIIAEEGTTPTLQNGDICFYLK
jgi:hypothetical protein